MRLRTICRISIASLNQEVSSPGFTMERWVIYLPQHMRGAFIRIWSRILTISSQGVASSDPRGVRYACMHGVSSSSFLSFVESLLSFSFF
jgi:hypothetical protein